MSNRSQANVGLVFCFICTPATGLYLIYVSMWQQWWQDKPSLCQRAPELQPWVPVRAHGHKAFASVYLGGDCRAQLLCPPSPSPLISPLPFSLGERVVGLFGTAQPLCFLPGCPQEAGSAVILAAASRGCEPYKAKTCRRASVLTFIINTSCLYLTPWLLLIGVGPN